jgi:hypothetical protein
MMPEKKNQNYGTSSQQLLLNTSDLPLLRIGMMKKMQEKQFQFELCM